MKGPWSGETHEVVAVRGEWIVAWRSGDHCPCAYTLSDVEKWERVP